MSMLRTLQQITENEEEPETNATIAKITAMCVLFLASFVIGNLPIKLNHWFKWSSDAKNNSPVKFLLGLGGGVLLCTTFVHLLPEVNEHFEDLNLTPDIEIPYAEVLMCIGFFTMYFIEECVHVYLHKKETVPNFEAGIDNPHEADLEIAIRRSVSIRRGEEDLLKRQQLALAIHQNENSHARREHSHLPLPTAQHSAVTIIRGLLVVLALSIHELFEGLSVGLESSSHTVWYMFGAVSAHKLVIAFCIGIELVTSGLKTLFVIVFVFMFAVVSPLGIGIGILVSTGNDSSTTVVSVILQGLASGTLMYVVFFEILQGDKRSGMKQYGAVLLGFLVMFGVTLLGT
ncbi:zinc transporter ZIP1-like isoform X2 [Diorhabda carinulata]|nr:zinc transporter ZIP1-like isoform X2 [Diorhabda carinulata]XP_057660344.1 zinc transporter ZIP1-like isoform X2 [Diorhabda carinulata]XP_057660345.1 zinc transporter ZIP1-like isoform X2 [Diorhabda carinulata]